jgi:hypothetical protein
MLFRNNYLVSGSILSLLLIFGLPFKISAQHINDQITKIDVLSYIFNISLNDHNDNIECTAVIDIKILQAIEDFYIDLDDKSGKNGMVVIDVSSSKGGLKWNQNDDKIFFYGSKWKANEIFQVTISYEGIPEDGLIISDNKYSKRTFFADNWPDRAHFWIPVVDHPSDKALVDFIVTVPQHYEVIANGILQKTKLSNKKSTTYHYKTSVPVPTKVMVIGVADFSVKEYGFVKNTKIDSWIFENSPASGADDYIFSMEAVKFFSDSIGEFPYEKLSNVQSKTVYGGMENAGNIFYYENSVNGRKNSEDLVVHEVAHQWFGNSVTEKNWSDIWLSEGFATYLTDMYLENKYGKDLFKLRLDHERNEVRTYKGKYPIVNENVANLRELLNPDTYQKAAWVLHMLRNKIGDKLFYEVLRKYFSSFRDKNAGTADFIKIVNEVSNTDQNQFFNQWLFRNEIPELKLSWKIQNDIAYFEVLQQNLEFNLVLPVKLRDGKNEEVIILKIRKKRETYAFPLKNLLTSQKISITIDPEVTVLQNCDIEAVKSTIGIVPLIDGTDLLMEGDMLFQDLDCGELCQAIESVTKGYRNAHFSHVGIVINGENNELKVLEAIGEQVKLTDIDQFLLRYYDLNGRPKVVVGRPKSNVFLIENLRNADIFIGNKYDDIFNIEDDKYYCSELVYFLYKDLNGKNLFQLAPMTFKNEKTGDFFPSWKKYYEVLNTDIPEGKPGINPGGISLSDKIDIIYRYGDPEGWE